MMGGNPVVNQMNPAMSNVNPVSGGKPQAMNPNAAIMAGGQGQMMGGNGGNQPAMMAQNTNMMQSNMVPNPNVMQTQQNPGMMNPNAGNNMAAMQGIQGNAGGQNAMFGNQQQQYQNLGQNFGGYANQGMNQQGSASPNMMGNFNQMSQQRQQQTQADYLAQQRAAMQTNRGQFIPTPNVTMNTMAGAAPPYPRQGPAQGVGGGKPVMPNTVQSQQFQANQQRMRQQMLMQQQQQQQQGEMK